MYYYLFQAVYCTDISNSELKMSFIIVGIYVLVKMYVVHLVGTLQVKALRKTIRCYT